MLDSDRIVAEIGGVWLENCDEIAGADQGIFPPPNSEAEPADGNVGGDLRQRDQAPAAAGQLPMTQLTMTMSEDCGDFIVSSKRL